MSSPTDTGPADDAGADRGAEPGGSVPAAARPARPRARLSRPAVLTVVAMTAGGAPLGVLWSMLAPWVPVVKTEQGAAVRGGDPEYFVAADGWFTFLGLGLGIAAGIAIWLLLPRLRGPVGLFAVGLGGLGAAAVAWVLGRQIGLADYRRTFDAAELGAQLQRPPDLQAGAFDLWLGVVPAWTGAVLAPAFGAVLAYTMLAGWSRYPSLRPEPEPVEPEPAGGPADPPPAVPGPGAGPVSSNSPAPRAPAAEPAPPAPGVTGTPPD
ncbi:DUF2567 domain-containing protein [Solwaraspora sp. WMMB335]|uniref:DUF2567 domain-containing protein n=1 Tax=Solwaraspora sp. WMMB335 TaxID=3404118 RepID=UPI003B929522